MYLYWGHALTCRRPLLQASDRDGSPYLGIARAAREEAPSTIKKAAQVAPSIGAYDDRLKMLPPGMVSNSIVVAALLSSTAVGLVCLLCGMHLLRRRGDGSRPMQVSANLKAALSGLLFGISLLVMLPSAMEGLHPNHKSDHVLFAFAIGPLCMFFFHHVVLGHNCAMHGGGHGGSAANAAQQADAAWEKAREDGTVCDDGSCDTCQPQAGLAKAGLFTGRPQMCLPIVKPPPEAEAAPPPRFPRLAAACAVLLRVSAWVSHAMLDGFMIGSSQSVGMVCSIALPVALCATQDASSLVLGSVARGDAPREALSALLILAASFPIGAASALALHRWPFAFAGGPSPDNLL